jgi:hypothetical protein
MTQTKKLRAWKTQQKKRTLLKVPLTNLSMKETPQALTKAKPHQHTVAELLCVFYSCKQEEPWLSQGWARKKRSQLELVEKAS